MTVMHTKNITKNNIQQLKTLSYHVALQFSDTHPELELDHTGTFLILPKLYRDQTLGHIVTVKHFISTYPQSDCVCFSVHGRCGDYKWNEDQSFIPVYTCTYMPLI